MSKDIFEQFNIKWILLIAFVAHLPMLHNGFTYYSDDNYVLNNVLIHKINGATVSALFSTYFDGHYHPLTLLSLAFTYFISGTNALGYQLTNLVFHLANCWLIYKILTQLGLKKKVIVFAAIVFAIHPLNVESVARITERKDTQYVFFLLFALYFFMVFCGDVQKRKFYLLSVVCFVLSLLSKGQAVVFPLILYVIGFYQFKTKGEKIKHQYIAPLFLLSFLFAYLNYRAQLVTGYLSETETISIKQIFAYPSTIISSYVLKLFLPFQLSAQYPIPVIDWRCILYVFFLLMIVTGIYFLWKHKKYLAFMGILLYIVSVFPMLRIIPVSENFMPDRYNYLGLLGFGVFFSAIAFELIDKYKKINIRTILLLWLSGLSLLCFARTAIWKDGLSIWEDAYKKQPDDKFAMMNYGTQLVKTKKDIGKGLSLIQKSITSDSGNILKRSNYVDILNALGKKELSLAEVKKIMNVKPSSSSDHSNKGILLLQYGMVNESIVELNWAVNLKPDYAKNRINRAGYYYNQFLFEKTLSELDSLEDLHSNYEDVLYLMRTNVYINLSKPQQAQTNLSALKSLDPDNKQLKLLQEKIDLLNLIGGDEVQKMDPETKRKYAATLYSKGLYYQSFRIFSELQETDSTNEKLINNLMACAFNLSRPELMKEYIGLLKENKFPVNDGALNYLKGLGMND